MEARALVFRVTFYFTKLTGLFFVQSAGILLSANVVGKDKSPLGAERLVQLRLCGTELFGGVAGARQAWCRNVGRIVHLSARSNVFSAENACCSSASSNALASNAISKVIIFNPEAK